MSIVVTGFDIISSLGLNAQENWQNIKNGKNGVTKITRFDTSNLETKVGASLPNNFEDYVNENIKLRTRKQMSLTTKMGFLCAHDAVNMSGINFTTVDKKRVAVIIGVVDSRDNIAENDKAKNRIVKNMPNAIAAWISMEYKVEGPSFTVNTACSSSAYAVSLAKDLIKSGQVDIVITGGTDSILNPYSIEGFNALYALSTNDNPSRASCPFSMDRDGFVIGEGAGMLILESEEYARKRNAKIYATILGTGLTSEAYNIMAPKADGVGMAYTMEKALLESKIKKEKIDYINAHGTSTYQNDRLETFAIQKVFETHANKLFVSSTKSMIGHTVAAAGAIELIVTIMAIQYSVVPPTINYTNPDPDLSLNYVPNKSIKKEINYAISNSFAFGGHNASIVVGKYI